MRALHLILITLFLWVNPVAAADIDPFLGEWIAQRGSFIVVSTSDNGEIQLAMPPQEYWRAEFQNIRLEEDRLKFEQINYIKVDVEHPYSGMVNYVEMWMDETGQMHYAAWTDEQDQHTGTLQRK